MWSDNLGGRACLSGQLGVEELKGVGENTAFLKSIFNYGVSAEQLWMKRLEYLAGEAFKDSWLECHDPPEKSILALIVDFLKKKSPTPLHW